MCTDYVSDTIQGQRICQPSKNLPNHLKTYILVEEIETERYTHLNAEFQRIAGRDHFLSDQCKEIEENNRLGKTKNFFKNIRHTKGILHAKMETLKNRNNKWA